MVGPFSHKYYMASTEFVNTGGATCQDVLELIRQIQEEVFEKKGIRLEPEVRVTGEV